MRILTALVLVAALGACGKKPAPAPVVQAPAPSAPAVKPPAPPPPLTPAQKIEVEDTFGKARQLASEATSLYNEGVKLRQTGGPEAANDTFVKAKKLYQQALSSTEYWIEADLGKVTKGQIDAYLGKYVAEREVWLKNVANMGKLHE